MNSDAAHGRNRPTLSVVVPTYREAANVPVLFERLKTALDGLPWEMVVVDDDLPDGTADVAFSHRRARFAHALPQARQSRRTGGGGDRGMAVVERRFRRGDRRRSAARRDDPAENVPALARAAGISPSARACPMRTDPGGLSPARQRLSDLGAWFFRLVAGVDVSDPMSGFFMTRRDDRRRTRAARCRPTASRFSSIVMLSRRRQIEDRRDALRVSQTRGGRIRSFRRWSGSISSASSRITRAAACCRSASCCSR